VVLCDSLLVPTWDGRGSSGNKQQKRSLLSCDVRMGACVCAPLTYASARRELITSKWEEKHRKRAWDKWRKVGRVFRVAIRRCRRAPNHSGCASNTSRRKESKKLFSNAPEREGGLNSRGEEQVVFARWEGRPDTPVRKRRDSSLQQHNAGAHLRSDTQVACMHSSSYFHPHATPPSQDSPWERSSRGTRRRKKTRPEQAVHTHTHRRGRRMLQRSDGYKMYVRVCVSLRVLSILSTSC
jgi:hypothetical protein